MKAQASRLRLGTSDNWKRQQMVYKAHPDRPVGQQKNLEGWELSVSIQNAALVLAAGCGRGGIIYYQWTLASPSLGFEKNYNS
jgi:hypothetical protein